MREWGDALSAPADARGTEEVAALLAIARRRVAFFDFKHGQTGVAPNAIELHPILGFACLSGRM